MPTTELLTRKANDLVATKLHNKKIILMCIYGKFNLPLNGKSVSYAKDYIFVVAVKSCIHFAYDHSQATLTL